MTAGEGTRTLGAVAALGRRLRELGFVEAAVRGRWRGRLVGRTSPGVVAMAERRAGDDALGDAIRFWQLGLPATPSSLASLLDPELIDGLEAAGLIESDRAGWRAALAFTPHRGSLIAHDFDDGEALPADHVVGVGPAPLTLASLTPRGHVERVLDIGTGGGIQALLARAHADEVVATDLSERALWMARLSAAASEVDGIDFRIGDGLEPVGSEDFDLIVCNPPFVVSPDEDLVFRDGGEGDHLSRTLVRDVVPHLRPGGTACILVNWVVVGDADEVAVPRAWVADLGCDALILHHDHLDPLAYAERWAMMPAAAGLEERRATIARWTEHLQGMDARAVAAGAIILRRTGQGSRVRAARMPKRPTDGGEQVERMLAAIGRFSGPADPRLLGAVFRLVHGHRLEQRLVYGHEAYRARDAVLRLDRSAGILGTVPADLLEILFGIDGERRLDDVVADAAAAREIPPADLRMAATPVVLELFELGFLEVVGGD